MVLVAFHGEGLAWASLAVSKQSRIIALKNKTISVDKDLHRLRATRGCWHCTGQTVVFGLLPFQGRYRSHYSCTDRFFSCKHYDETERGQYVHNNIIRWDSYGPCSQYLLYVIVSLINCQIFKRIAVLYLPFKWWPKSDSNFDVLVASCLLLHEFLSYLNKEF